MTTLLEDGSSIVILQLVNPASQNTEVLTEMHEPMLGGNLEEDKTLDRVHEYYYWPGYHYEYCDRCKMCPNCADTKTSTSRIESTSKAVKLEARCSSLPPRKTSFGPRKAI